MKLILTTTLILALNYLSAQITQILPFTGIRYTENGVYAKSIEVSLDDKTWTSNLLPSNSSFKIKLNKPQGFTVDEQNNYHPNIRVTMFNSKGDTVGHAEKFIGDGVVFDQFSLDDLTLTLGFKPGTPLGSYLIKAAFYDQLSPKSLDLSFNVELMEDVNPKPITNYEATFYSYTGYVVKTSSFKAEEVLLGTVDSLKYKDKVIIPVSILGIELPKEQFLDTDLFSFSHHTLSNTTDIKAQSQMQVRTASDSTTQLDLLFILPKSDYKKDDFVQFRWDSKDKEYVLDCILKLH